ncbi:hypothetical protein V8E51_013831 [Hyaloscypha variabilis]
MANDEMDWDNFNWLGRGCRGSTYTSYFQISHLPNCAFDWGQDGYAGCSNHGGGLLCLSQPSRVKGLLMARGHFATSLYASLSRSQLDFDGPSTFGLEVSRWPYAYNPHSEENQGITQVRNVNKSTNVDVLGSEKGSSFRLGSMLDRGCFNYRWPVTEYYLDLHPNYDAIERENENRRAERKEDRLSNAHNASQPVHVGTCQMLSCAKDNIFYQVLRIEEMRAPVHDDYDASFPPESQIVLTIGGPVWFQSFNDGGHELRAGVGTMMRRAFFRKAKNKTHNDDDDEQKIIDDSGPEPVETLRYWDNSQGGRGLEAKVYQLEDGEYKPVYMTKSPIEAENGLDYTDGRTSLTVYNAVIKLGDVDRPRHFGKAPAPRSATFLAAIRLFEGDEREDYWRPSALPTSRDLYNYVGVNPSCFHATGAMWERIVLDQRTAADPVLDPSVFNMIGRSLEKILQVDIIPATFEDDEEHGHRDSAALVSNLFVRGNVDLKSLFWKIRFLIRTHKFLSHVHKLNDSSIQNKGKSPAGTKNFQSIEEAQMYRIQIKIENVIRYLAKEFLEPSFRPSMMCLMPDDYKPGSSNYYYVMMTIWYVYRYFRKNEESPGLNFEWTSRLSKNRPYRQSRLFERNRLPPDQWTFPANDVENVPLLQWYHYGSLLKLCEHGVLPESWQEIGLSQKVSRLEEVAKMVSSKKLSSRKPYVADDEMFDRLSFLSPELGLENLMHRDVGIIESLSIKRIKERDFTRSLNPGWRPPDEEGSTTGPWEIYVLCHHSGLVVLMKEEQNKQEGGKEQVKADLETSMRNICTFLNAENTLVPCNRRRGINIDHYTRKDHVSKAFGLQYCNRFRTNSSWWYHFRRVSKGKY